MRNRKKQQEMVVDSEYDIETKIKIKNKIETKQNTKSNVIYTLNSIDLL